MTYSLRMDAQLENLSAIRDFVEDITVRLQAAPSAVPNIVLAVDEMVTNIIAHGYQGRPGSIEIELSTQGESLIIRLRDQAPPFDPTSVPPPDLTVPFEKRAPGGLGIYLTRKVMDEIHHHATAASGNELTLIKHQIIPLSAGGTP